MTTALHRLPATTLAAMVRRGEVSVLELTDAFLARIERRNEALQAFVHVAAFRARRTARRLDDARRRGELPQSPLAGLPLGIKDLYPVRLMPVRAGSRALGPMIAPVDGPNVRRLREAGVVILGKLATSEFGAMPFTEPDTHPPTRNPWDPSTTAGGSSGGTAAAVAAGLVPLGHGSDGGGSIRIPAAMCGLFGFKPSRGALFHASPTEKLLLATEGPLAHSVSDAVAMLQVLATDDRFAQPLAPPTALKVRVVVDSSEPALAPVDARMVRATQQVAKTLASLGHRVDAQGPIPLTVDEFLPLWQRTLAWAPTLPPWRDRLQPITRWLREAGARIAEDDARARLARVTATVDAWWGDADVVVLPTVSCLPPKVGSWRHDDPALAFQSAIPMAIFTAGFNASGQPAMNVPVVVDGVPQPVGVQIVARRGNDALLVAVARQLEEALGGFDHRPPTEP
jgi:amidase